MDFRGRLIFLLLLLSVMVLLNSFMTLNSIQNREGSHSESQGMLAPVEVNKLPVVKVNNVTNMKPVLAAPQVVRRQSEELQLLLFYLNLTEAEAPLHLPLTLESPLLLNNPHVCRTEDGGDVHVLFLVHTAPNHTERRQDMRSTFMAPHHYKLMDYNVRAVFLLGRVSSSQEQASLEAEHGQHGDLVQGDFLDTYHNLSHKGVMGFRWVATHCPRARLLVKLDDDMFFDTLKLLQHYWPGLRAKRRAILCNLSKARATSAIIYRAGKWAVEARLFRNETRYPYHYCTGNMVLLTGDLVASLYQAARRAPFFWVDDVYLFGMLPAIASDVRYYFAGYGNGMMYRTHQQAMRCLTQKEASCRLLGAIATGSGLKSLWDKSLALHRKWSFSKHYVRV